MHSTLSYHEYLFILPIINAELANAKCLVGDLKPGGPKKVFQEYLDKLQEIQTKLISSHTAGGA